MSNRTRLLILVDAIPVLEAPAGLLSNRLPLDLDPGAFSVEIAAIRPLDPSATPVAPAVPVCSLDQAFGSWRHDLLTRLAIRRLLRRRQPDCLCAVGTHARRQGLAAARALGIPLRIALVDDLGEELTPALVAALCPANRNATRIIVDSYAAARRLMRQERVSRNAIDIIHPGVDCTQFPTRTPGGVIEAKHRLGLSRQQPLIVVVAPFGRRHNHQMLLEAAARLLRHQPEARFALIGSGDRDATLDVKREIQRLRLFEHVHLFSFLDQLPSWLQAADVGVSISYFESASRSLLLYMASGLPIVALNTGGNNELITHGESGYLADLTDIDQLAMYILVLLLSPEQSARFGAAARRRAETDFPMERTRRAFEDYFRTLTYATSPPPR